MKEYNKINFKLNGFPGLSEHFDKRFLQYQKLYNNSSDKLTTINNLSSIRIELTRSVERLERIISSLNESIEKVIKSLKDTRSKKIQTGEQTEVVIIKNYSRQANLNDHEFNVLINTFLTMHNSIFANINDGWTPLHEYVDKYKTQFTQLVSVLIKDHHFPKSYVDLTENLADRYNDLVKRKYERDFLVWMIDIIIKNDNFISKNDKVDISFFIVNPNYKDDYNELIESATQPHKNEIYKQYGIFKETNTVDKSFELIKEWVNDAGYDFSEYSKTDTPDHFNKSYNNRIYNLNRMAGNNRKPTSSK